MGIVDKLELTFNNATFFLGKKPIDKSDFIRKNVESIINLTTDQPERAIILHPGTSLLLYLASILICFKVFLSDETEDSAFIDKLTVGDLVVYGGKRGEFKGKDTEGRVVIENLDRGVPTINRVPQLLWRSIVPYNGEGKVLDGRGIRSRRKALKFLSRLFEFDPRDIRTVTTKSAVIVCNKSDADSFLSDFRITFDKLTVSVSELFTAAFYTYNDVHHYPGNYAKVEPLLKFTSKLSVARELVMEDGNIETLIISGAQYFVEDVSEIASLYNRSSLKTILLLGDLCTGINSGVFSAFETLQSVVWDEKAVSRLCLQNPAGVCEDSVSLQERLKNSITYKSSIVETEGVLEAGFSHCRTLLYELMKQPEDKTDVFVMKAYWMLNLLERAFFPITTMEALIREGQINALSPAREIGYMNMIAKEFSGVSLGDKMLTVCQILSGILSEYQYNNSKFDMLINVIRKGKTAVISDKTYFGKIFLDASPDHVREVISDCTFYTPNKFDTTILFEQVIVMGITEWQRLNPFLLTSSTASLTFIIHPSEKQRLLRLKNYTFNKLRWLNHRDQPNEGNGNLDVVTAGDMSSKVAMEDSDGADHDDFGELLQRVSLNHFLGDVKTVSISASQYAEIKRVATLETGERVFFTKYYVPYVFDADEHSVMESDVMSLQKGDILIFTNYSNDTRDIVETVMSSILTSDTCDANYRKSYENYHYWKLALKKYMDANDVSFRRLSEEMGNLGRSKHEATLRAWLDEDSHIVGPRDRESFRVIANLTKDHKMLANPDLFFNACRDVRSMRVRILKYIGRNIIQAHNNTDESRQDEILNQLPIDLSKMSVLVEIDRIVDVEDLTIPVHFVNRPQNI